MISIAGLVLAAGESRRFGSPKALADFHGKPALARVVETASKGGCARIYVVLGADRDRITKEATKLSCTIAINERFQEGQTSSLQAGLSVISPGVQGVAFFLVDHPLAKPETVALLLKEFRAWPDKVIRPTLEGRGGHPTIIPIALKERILEIPSGDSVRSVLFEEGHCHDVPVDDAGVRAHFNTHEEYEELKAEFSA